MKFRSAIAKVLAINPIPIPILNTRIFAMADGPHNQLATATFKLFYIYDDFYFYVLLHNYGVSDI